LSTLSVQTITDVRSFDFGNTQFSGAYNASNAAYASANASYAAQNAAFGVANAAFAAANNVGPQIAPAFNTANAAFASANNVAPQVTPSFNTANAAFGVANTALQNTNVTLAGNLTMTGSMTLANAPFYEASANINYNYTINTGMNAFTPGPVAIANGIFVTIPSGSYWSVT
jgi:hypothetical protein